MALAFDGKGTAAPNGRREPMPSRCVPSNMRRALFLGPLLALTLAGWPSQTRAEMWCADPLWVHEWGVQVFGASGATRSVGPGLPRWFHSRVGSPSAAGPPVRHMPVDGGERELPVVHFYAPSTWRPVPLGLQVGFARGEATRWYPQVDDRRRAADANGPAARRARRALLTARRARPTGFGSRTMAPLGRDPTHQLSWDHLVLAESPRHGRQPTPVPWVRTLRGFDSALWVNGASESERFLFYEGRTAETPAITLARGGTFARGRRHYLLQNTSSRAIHDVFVVHRRGASTYVFHTPSIPAGRHAGFVLEQHRVRRGLTARTRGALRERIVDSNTPAPTNDSNWGRDGCVMQRDPALPTEAAAGHRLYAHEADAILEIWGARFFDGQGTTIVYREDTAYLDEAMPLSVHTDMYHHVQLRRLGLALMENVALP